MSSTPFFISYNIVADTLQQIVPNPTLHKEETSLISSLSEFFLALFIFVIILVIAAVLVYCLICLFCHRIGIPKNSWVTLPLDQWSLFFFMKHCKDVYCKRFRNDITKEFENTIFDETLCNHFYPTSCRERAQKMLANYELVNKYLAETPFTYDTFRRWWSEYSTTSTLRQKIKKVLPSILANNEKAVDIFIKFINAGDLDEHCLPRKDTGLKKYYYYMLANEIWIRSGLISTGDKNQVFAELWHESFLCEKYQADKLSKEGQIKNLYNNLSSGQHSSKTSNQKDEYLDRINKIIIS